MPPNYQPLPPKEGFDLPPQAVMRLGQHSLSSCYLCASLALCRLHQLPTKSLKLLERAMGFEPTTPTLARLCSTSRPGPAASALEGKTSREAA